MSTQKETEKKEFIEKLRAEIKPGDTVYTILRHKSASGMSRTIGVLVFRDNEPQFLSYWVAKAAGYTFSTKHEAITVSGCGMDMGYALVYDLGRVLFPDGFDLPDGVRGRNGDTSGHDNDGGYALKHRWL